MMDTLESIRRTNRVITATSMPIRYLEQIANGVGELELPNTEIVLILIQDAIAAAEAAAYQAPVEAPRDELLEVYHTMQRPPDTPIAVPIANPALTAIANSLDRIASVHRAALAEVVGDSDPATLPTHFRNALWQALACQDAIRQAGAAARQASRTSLVIAGV